MQKRKAQRKMTERLRKMRRSGQAINPYLLKQYSSTSGLDSDECDYKSPVEESRGSTEYDTSDEEEETLESIFAHSGSEDTDDSFEVNL